MNPNEVVMQMVDRQPSWRPDAVRVDAVQGHVGLGSALFDARSPRGAPGLLAATGPTIDQFIDAVDLAAGTGSRARRHPGILPPEHSRSKLLDYRQFRTYWPRRSNASARDRVNWMIRQPKMEIPRKRRK